ncbi:MAG: hypothetical protein JSU77_02230 [Fidelibacterota bacterium]|nr:MAG: hypothetical protein JSU77_02230 [Candidatus Neomarinimicrobiota bacterium]
MRLCICFILSLSIAIGAPFTDDHIYPVEDFYNRNVELPIDYANPEGGTFILYYQLSKNFDKKQPTIFFINDSQQAHGAPGKVDALAERYQFDDSFNLVRIEPRGRKYSYIDVRSEDGSIDWEKAYHLLSSWQSVEDIERVRQDLFSENPDTKIYLYGRSGGGYLVQEYLARYSHNAAKAFMRCAPNPLIMKELGYLESKHLVKSLDAVNPGLKAKLKEIIDRETVPKLELLWLLLRLGYQHQDPGPSQAVVINELHENNMDTYTSYMEKRGFSYSQLKGNTALYEQMGTGIFMRALECDGLYLLGPEPDYIDPLYYCYRDLSSSVFHLIEEGRVPPPTYPSLDDLRGIETEVFYLAGKNDHMSPYQIGIELGKYIKNYELYISDDNHLFQKHKDCYPQLRNAFFKYSSGSKELREARTCPECSEWKPD